MTKVIYFKLLLIIFHSLNQKQNRCFNKNDKGQNSINKPVENIATKDKVKESNEVRSNELPKEEPKQEVKKAKDWGRASNDPRNKS